jgi:hypothetical protein
MTLEQTLAADRLDHHAHLLRNGVVREVRLSWQRH